MSDQLDWAGAPKVQSGNNNGPTNGLDDTRYVRMNNKGGSVACSRYSVSAIIRSLLSPESARG
jgi:hypothetical protein